MKKSCSVFSVFVCAIGDRLEMIPLMIIGFAKPRAFKKNSSKKLGLDYYSNKTEQENIADNNIVFCSATKLLH